MNRNDHPRLTWHRIFSGSLLLGALLLAGCGRTPQLNGNQESLGAADALWTAVTAKDLELVDKSAQRLEQLHTAGTLPDDAFESLQNVIGTARAGQWAEARASLKAFVKGQRPAKSAG